MKKKKKKYKSVINKRIWKSVNKLIGVFLLLVLSSSFMLMRGTNAGFLDEEKIEGNIFSATTLDFSISSNADFSPKVSPSKETLRSVSVAKEGISDFQYKISAYNFSGDDDLCDALEIKDDLDGIYQDLGSYVSSIIDNLTKNNWNFTIRLTDNDEELADKNCSFNFKIESWQKGGVYGIGGFTDIETLFSQVNSEHWTNIADHLVINEVYYDVDGSHGTETDNEWIEIYNPTSDEVNIKNWEICDNMGCANLTSSDLEIPANGYALVTKEVSTWSFWTIPGSAIKIVLGNTIGNGGLSNSDDRLILKNSSGIEIDSMSYGTDTSKLNPPCPDVNAGHSLARKPAGQDLNIKEDFEDLSIPNPGTNPHTIVMNEIMPNPIGDDEIGMPEGEWIELYNYGEYLVDLKDWKLEDGDGHVLKIEDSNTSSESTAISGGERIVIYRNGDEDFDLDDDGDEIKLIDEKGLVKDYYSFGKTIEGKSIARFPDAVGPWIDPESTPGEKNELGKAEFEYFRLLAYEKCFDEEKVKKKSKEEICVLEFLQYLGMIEELDDNKINNSTLLDILELKKEEEKKKLEKMFIETKEMTEEKNIDIPVNREFDSNKEDIANKGELLDLKIDDIKKESGESMEINSSEDVDENDIMEIESGVESRKDVKEEEIIEEESKKEEEEEKSQERQEIPKSVYFFPSKEIISSKNLIVFNYLC